MDVFPWSLSSCRSCLINRSSPASLAVGTFHHVLCRGMPPAIVPVRPALPRCIVHCNSSCMSISSLKREIVRRRASRSSPGVKSWTDWSPTLIRTSGIRFWRWFRVSRAASGSFARSQQVASRTESSGSNCSAAVPVSATRLKHIAAAKGRP